MKALTSKLAFLVCDDNPHTRRLVGDVLRGIGVEHPHIANDGEELLSLAAELHPRVVISSSRVPKLSGLEFTRMIRAGYKNMNRSTSIIVMTDTPTQAFLTAARDAGVDEMLVRPFTAQALIARVDAVLRRPRRFVDSVVYTGPCRRRRMLEDYGGPLKRFSDPLSDGMAWEADSNRELVRLCVHKISELCNGLTPGDRRKLREIYGAVGDAEKMADDLQDQAMGEAARSLARYISAVGASSGLDIEVISTHIDAMQKLGFLGSNHIGERHKLVTGLAAIVEKRLGRTPQPGVI